MLHSSAYLSYCIGMRPVESGTAESGAYRYNRINDVPVDSTAHYLMTLATLPYDTCVCLCIMLVYKTLELGMALSNIQGT